MAADRLRGQRMSRIVTGGIGVGRVALGVAVLVRPTMLASMLGVDSVTARRTAWALRMTGARDVGLGLGTVWALAASGPVRPWLLAQAVGDGTDAVVFAAAARTRQLAPAPSLASAALAAAGLLGSLAAARDADRPG